MMNRRDFSLHLATVAGLGVSCGAQAQGGPVEGVHYGKLAQPLAMPSSGKVEVVEFFSYACPHCNALEPTLEAWVRKLPADVSFRRVPAGFNPTYEFLQKLFYALEALNLLETQHKKVFAALHVERKNLNKDADVLAFFSAQGLDGAKVVEVMKSFGVAGKARQAKQLSQSYQIEGVPTLGIHGRYYTSPSQAKGHEAVFAVTDHLIGLVRKTPH